MIRNQNQPVPVTGFFCEWMSVMLICFLAVSYPATAQIVLPDAPDQHEAQEESAPSLPDLQEPSEEELQQLIRTMGGQQGRGILFDEPTPNVQKNGSKLDDVERVFETAPELVRIVCELVTGEEIWGEIHNRSFRVKNNAGEFPVLLHQLTSMTRIEGQEHPRFLFTGGDVLTGQPQLDLLRVRMADGGERQQRIEEIRQFTISDQEP